MRWKKVDGAGDVEDRRGQGGGYGGGLPGGIPPIRMGGGLGAVILVVALLFFGSRLLGGDGTGGLVPGLDSGGAATGSLPENDSAYEFTKYVAKDTQDFWAGAFARSNRDYPRATVVVFTSGTRTGCGVASAATGPFYCPADRKVYLDLGFFNELSRRFGAPGDFAVAYVIAHELGHHVQTVLGIEERMRQLQRDDPANANGYSVRLELQADCLAGVWGHTVAARGDLDPGDIEEALGAAQAVGDDRLGARSPEQWTHGSSALRAKWFKKGFDSGKSSVCDTFSGDL